MGNVTTCIANLGAKFGISDLENFKSIQEQAKHFQEALENIALDDSTRAETLEKMRKAIGDSYKQGLLDKAQTVTATATGTVRILDKAKQLAEFGDRDLTAKDIVKAIDELIVGEGGSVMHNSTGLKGQYTGEFISRLMEKDIYTILKKTSNSKSLNEEALRTMFDLADGIELDKLALKELKPEQAKELFKAVRFLQDRIYFDKKQAGINIGKQKNFIFQRRYSKEKMRKMGKVNFMKFMDEAVDTKATFSKELVDSKEAREQYFSTLFDQLDGGSGSFTSADEGTFTPFLKSRMKERELIFNAGKSFDVMRELSPITDINTMLGQEIEEASSMITNFRFFGPNPTDMANGVAKNLKALAKGKGLSGDTTNAKLPKILKMTDETALGKQIDKISSALESHVTTLTQKPRNEITAIGHIAQTLSNLQVASKLGATTLRTAMPTDAVTTYMAVFNDRGFSGALKSLPDQVKIRADLARMSDAQVTKLQADMMMYVDIQNMTYQDKLGVNTADDFSGGGLAKGASRMSSKLASFSMKVGLNDWQFKRAFLENGAHSLITLGQLKKGFAGDKFLEGAWNDLNFTSVEKEVFKDIKMGHSGIAAGDKMLNLKSVYEIPLENFGSKDINVNKARRAEMVQKITGFSASRGGMGTPKPNLRTSSGTGNKLTDKDAIWRSMLLFKNTIWHMTDIFKRQVGRVNEAGGTTALGSFAASIGAGSLASYMVTEVISSAILDRKSKTLGLIDGSSSWEDFALDLTGKMSPAPFYTDMAVRMIQQRDMWGQSSLGDFAMGPVGSMFRDLENIGKSRNPGK